MKTPYGVVRLKHWRALIKHESKFLPNLELAYKLTNKHLNPEGYQKMNTQLAYDVRNFAFQY